MYINMLSKLLPLLLFCLHCRLAYSLERSRCPGSHFDGNFEGRKNCTERCIDEASLSTINAIEQRLKSNFSGIDMLWRVIQSKHGGGVWLQIGANTLDPVDNFNDPVMNLMPRIPQWSKYFVEPIPILYDQLKENVKAWPNSHAINVAIGINRAKARVVEYLPIYCLKRAVMHKDFQQKENLAHWANQICSFDEKHVLGHFPNNATIAFNVTTLSPGLLMRKYNIPTVDVMLLDTEGFDYKVLRNFPFSKVRPSVVIYEYNHLKEDIAAAEKYMRSHCYAMFYWHNNMFALAV